MKIEISVLRSVNGKSQHRKAGSATNLEDACAMAYGIARCNPEDWAWLTINWAKWSSDTLGGIGEGKLEHSFPDFFTRVQREYKAKRAAFLVKKKQIRWLGTLGEHRHQVARLVFGVKPGAPDADPEARRAFLALDFPSVLRRAEQLAPAAA